MLLPHHPRRQNWENREREIKKYMIGGKLHFDIKRREREGGIWLHGGSQRKWNKYLSWLVVSQSVNGEEGGEEVEVGSIEHSEQEVVKSDAWRAAERPRKIIHTCMRACREEEEKTALYLLKEKNNLIEISLFLPSFSPLFLPLLFFFTRVGEGASWLALWRAS